MGLEALTMLMPEPLPPADDRPRCPVCGAPMYAVQVGEGIYALPCFHWLYQGGRTRRCLEAAPPACAWS